MNSPREHRIKNDTLNAIKESQLHDKDVGSTQVQIAVLSSKVKRCQKHLKTHQKDKHNIRQIVKLVKKIKKLNIYRQSRTSKKV